MDQPHSTALEHERKAAPGARPAKAHRAATARRRRGWIWLLVLLALGAAAYFLWSKTTGAEVPATGAPAKGGGRAGRGPGVMPVVAVKVQKGNIGVFFDGLGAVTPVYTVVVKSRVDGELRLAFTTKKETSFIRATYWPRSTRGRSRCS